VATTGAVFQNKGAHATRPLHFATPIKIGKDHRLTNPGQAVGDASEALSNYDLLVVDSEVRRTLNPNIGDAKMPRGVRKNAAKSGQVNKAELIRQTAKAMGKTVRPRDIIAALKEKGVVVTSPQVSKTLKAAGFHRKSRGTKSAAAATGGAETSKAQRIRDVAKALGNKVRPRDVIAELERQGIKVSSAQVSMTLRSAGYRRRRRGRKVAAAVHPAAGNGLNLDALIAAKALIAKVGSVEAAEEALRAMKKLG
jgi:arginine repressor